MSSEHIIIVARHDITGEIRLPLENLTLYGTGGEESVLDTCRQRFDEDWTLSLYRPYGNQVAGAKAADRRPHPSHLATEAPK